MISCSIFKKKLNDYLYDYLADDFKMSMEQHIRGCRSCCRLYEQELQINNIFKDNVNIENIRFKSSREDIIRNIDKNRYSKKLSNKLYYSLRKNITAYAASVFIIFAAASGGIYYYSMHANNSGKSSYYEDNLGSAEKKDIAQVKETAAPETNNKTDSYTEKELPLPQSSADNEIQEILKKIENEPIGVAPFTIGYTSSSKVIFYNHSVLLAYSNDGSKPEYYAGIDLSRIDAGHVQGSIHTEFSFSPNGDYAVINNGAGANEFSSNKYPMFLYDLKKGDLNIISYEDKFLIKDAWSENSNYYVFGDKTGERIFVYDIASGTGNTLPFNKGSINNIFVSDSGDIILETLSEVNNNKTLLKYILRKDNSYLPEEYFIPGEIIAIREKNILYYHENTIYKLVSGESFAVKTLNPGTNIQKLQMEYAMFTDGACTYVYDYKDNFYKYTVLFTEDNFIEMSPDLKKVALINSNGARIIFADNLKNAVDIEFPISFSSSYKWLGNKSLVRVSQRENSEAIGQFVLYKINIPID